MLASRLFMYVVAISLPVRLGALYRMLTLSRTPSTDQPVAGYYYLRSYYVYIAYLLKAYSIPVFLSIGIFIRCSNR